MDQNIRRMGFFGGSYYELGRRAFLYDWKIDMPETPLNPPESAHLLEAPYDDGIRY